MKYILLPIFTIALAACSFEPPDDAKPRQVAGADDNPLVFAEVQHVDNTPFFTVPIVSARSSDSSYGSYSGETERNRLIVDSRNGASRPLLPDYRRVVVRWLDAGSQTTDARGLPRADAPRVAPGAYAAVIADPERKEQQVRRYDVLVGSFETGAQKYVSRQLDGVQDFWPTSDGKIAMIVKAGKHLLFRVYDPTNAALVTEAELRL